jgi:hypothetical protein
MDSDSLKLVLTVGVIVAALLYRASTKGKLHQRITPYRNPLVPENFHRVCKNEADRRTIVWILLAPEEYSRDIAAYMTAQMGWKFVFIVPEKPAYPQANTLEFYQKTDIEIAIQRAYCIIAGPGVIETAAATARNSKLPLILSTGVGIAEWVPVAEKLAGTICILNSLRSAERLNSHLGRPSFFFPPPVFPKQFITHTSRKFITLLPYRSQHLANEIVAALPQFEFMVVGPLLPVAPNVRLVDPSTMKEVYTETGILCVLETPEQFCRVAIEAAASGIPCVGTGGNGLKESMDMAAIYVPANVDAIVAVLIRLKKDPLAYKAASSAAFEHAAALDPIRTFEEFSGWLVRQ